MQSSTATGEGSLLGGFKKLINSYSDETAITQRISQQFPHISKSSLDDLVNLEKQKYSPKLLNSFNHAVTEEGAILENLMAQGKAKPSDYYNFVDKSLGKLDEAWFDYKGSLPLGTKVNSNEAKLYSSLKENFYKFVTNAEMFGEAGAKRAQMKQIRAEFMNAEKEFKSLFQKGKNPLDLKKNVLSKNCRDGARECLYRRTITSSC